jgi:hypothetical protein
MERCLSKLLLAMSEWEINRSSSLTNVKNSSTHLNEVPKLKHNFLLRGFPQEEKRRRKLRKHKKLKKPIK